MVTAGRRVLSLRDPSPSPSPSSLRCGRDGLLPYGPPADLAALVRAPLYTGLEER